jgi:hypothetical protein
VAMNLLGDRVRGRPRFGHRKSIDGSAAGV